MSNIFVHYPYTIIKCFILCAHQLIVYFRTDSIGHCFIVCLNLSDINKWIIHLFMTNNSL